MTPKVFCFLFFSLSCLHKGVTERAGVSSSRVCGVKRRSAVLALERHYDSVGKSLSAVESFISFVSNGSERYDAVTYNYFESPKRPANKVRWRKKRI